MKKKSKRLKNWPTDLFGLVVLLLAVCLAAASCAPTRPVVETGLPGADGLAARLRQKQKDLVRFAGKGSIEYHHGQAKYRFDFMVAAVRPDRLRLQAFDVVGRPVLTMTTDGERIDYLDYSEKKFYSGPATPDNFERLLPLGLKVSETITLLSGGQPLSAYEEARLEAETALGRETWRLSLFRTGQKQVERLWLPPNSLEVSRAEVGPPDKAPQFRLTYSDYRDTPDKPGVPLPFHIEAADRIGRDELIVDYQEIRYNPELNQNLFIQTPPPGLTAEPIPGDRPAAWGGGA